MDEWDWEYIRGFSYREVLEPAAPHKFAKAMINLLERIERIEQRLDEQDSYEREQGERD